MQCVELSGPHWVVVYIKDVGILCLYVYAPNDGLYALWIWMDEYIWLKCRYIEDLNVLLPQIK